MKSSFYFLLWMFLYIPLGWLGIGGDFSFFIVLMLVWLISGLVNKHMAKEIVYSRECSQIAIFRVILKGSPKQVKRLFLRNFLMDMASSVYLLVATVFIFIFTLSSNPVYAVLVGGIFGYFLFVSGRQTNASYAEYRMVRDDIDAGNIDNVRAHVREYESVVDYGMRKPTRRDKVLRWVNIICAALCLLSGILFAVIGFIGFAYGGFFYILNIAFGLLAFLYGLKDLISGIQGYSNVAV